MTACASVNDDDLGQWILRRLGAPRVCVELTQEHLQDAIDDAKRWFLAKKGFTRYVKIPMVANQTEYELPEEVDRVLDVFFQLSQTDIATLFTPISSIDERLPYDVFATGSAAGPYSTYYQLVQYIEQTKRVTNAEEDWRQEGRKLYIFPRPTSGTFVMVAYSVKCVRLDELSMFDYELLRRYALIMAKRDLGRVRSKFGEYPGAQGNITLDGDKLLTEAEAELEKINEEILQAGNPLSFMTG